MEVNIGEYILDITIGENENYYKNERYISEGCKCDGCQNYELAIERVAPEISELFNQLGIDIKKPAEVYVNYSENDILCYGGFYHIFGSVDKGESPWEIVSKTENTMVSHLDEDKMIRITDSFRVTFQKECSLSSENSSDSCIQMEILAYLPWMLETSNTHQD